MTTSLMPVSAMTEREFGIVFSKLAIQLRWNDADVASVKSYFEVLKEFPLPILEATARSFATEHGRKWFPSTAEWHEAAAQALEQHLRAALKSDRVEPWHHDCNACSDTGWQLHDCDGPSLCERTKPHAPHDYATICPCRPTNRTYTRHRQFGAGV